MCLRGIHRSLRRYSRIPGEKYNIGWNLQSMKLAICGTHFVGKTTLAEDLQEHLPGYELVMEPYYELEASGYDFSEIPDMDDFINQFHHSVNRISTSGNNVIFDRCPIDILAYMHAMDRDNNIQGLFQTAQEIMEQIDMLIFVPIEKIDFPPNEGAYLTKLRYAVQDILEDWVGDFNVKTIEVKGNVEARREQVLAAMK